jgi:hypothetical protein
MSLARGPGKVSAAKQMQVNMKNRLTGSGIAIHRYPVTRLGKTRLAGNIPGGQVELANGLGIAFLQVIDCRNVAFRNNYDVRWRLGINVAECYDFVTFVHNVCVYVTGTVFAKKTV